MLVRHRLLRLLRLVATLVTLFSAQPSALARAVVDPIALVATTSMVHAPSEETDDEPADDQPIVITPRLGANGGSTTLSALPALPALQSARALRERLYLEHCALLR